MREGVLPVPGKDLHILRRVTARAATLVSGSRLLLLHWTRAYSLADRNEASPAQTKMDQFSKPGGRDAGKWSPGADGGTTADLLEHRCNSWCYQKL